MAEQFKAESVKLHPDAKKVGLTADIQLDISTDFVDLYIGKGMTEAHVRWDRKTGKVTS